MTQNRVSVSGRTLGYDIATDFRTKHSLAALTIALFLAGALLCANFPGDRRQLNSALGDLDLHRKLLKEAREILRVNENELESNKRLLDNLKNAKSH